MKYNAFISYNHNPRDIRIAKELQARLEHYRIPKSIRADFGIDRISRVFLDVGELGVSSDLNDTIKQALDNTNYLIVICSPESKQSPWVHKEIDYFLSKHSVENILAVISEGEPREVFPDVIVEDREPLACDFRSKSPQSNKRELLRLVATIIGCKYDDLIQRQKQYRIKQIAIASVFVFLLMSAALTYLIWSNQKIKENYNNTLIEQSKALAVKSREALKNGDKISAVEYAIEALPGPNNERPIVPEAIYTLSDATDVYKNPEQSRWVGTKRYERKNGFISDFNIAKIGERTVLAELFNGGRIALYDADSGEEICTDYTERISKQGIIINNFTFTDDSKLILICSDSIILFDVASEKEIYNMNLEYSGANVPLLYDEKPPIAGNTIWVNAGGYNKKDESTEFLLAVDIVNGKIKRTIDVGNIIIGKITVAHDGNSMAYVESRLDELDRAFLIDDSKSEPVLIKEMEEISDVAFDGYGKLIVCGIDSKVDDQGYANAEMAFSDSTLYTIAMEKKIVVESINPEDNSKIWQMNCRKRVSGRPRLEMEFEDKAKYDKTFKDKTLCRINNILLIIDSEGTLEKELDFRSTIKGLFYESDRPNSFRVILRDGQIAGYFSEEDSIVTTYNLLNSPVDRVIVLDGCIYVMRTENSAHNTHNKDYITKYTHGGIDPAWADYEETNKELNLLASENVDAYKEYFVQVEIDYYGIGKLVTRHSKTGDVLTSVDLALQNDKEEKMLTRCMYAGLDESNGKAIFVVSTFDNNYKVITINVLTGKKEEIKFENDTYEDKNEYSSKNYYVLGRIYCKNGAAIMAVKEEWHIRENDNYKDGESFKIVQLNYENAELKEYEIPDISIEQLEYINQSDSRLALDVEKENVIFEYEGKLDCYGFNGGKKWESEKFTFAVKNIQYIASRVIVIGSTDLETVICFIDLQNGKMLGQLIVDDAFHNTSSKNPKQLSEEEVVIALGSDAYVVDCKSYKTIAIIPNYLGYNSTTNEIAIGNATHGYYGHVPFRSLDELIKLGNSIIGK